MKKQKGMKSTMSRIPRIPQPGAKARKLLTRLKLKLWLDQT